MQLRACKQLKQIITVFAQHIQKYLRLHTFCYRNYNRPVITIEKAGVMPAFS